MENRSPQSFECEACHDIGWMQDDGDIRRCICRAEWDKAELNRRLFSLCNLPAGTEHLVLGNFQFSGDPSVKEAYDAVLQLANGANMCVTLQGDVDQGKTHLLIAAVRCYLARGVSACYALVPELLDQLRNAYSPTSEVNYEYQFNFFKEVGLLGLDDLGMESPTRWAQEKLDMLIDYRYERRLPMIVTTNLSMNELPRRIASRLQRYLPEHRVITMRAKEYRLRAGK